MATRLPDGEWTDLRVNAPLSPARAMRLPQDAAFAGYRCRPALLEAMGLNSRPICVQPAGSRIMHVIIHHGLCIDFCKSRYF